VVSFLGKLAVTETCDGVWSGGSNKNFILARVVRVNEELKTKFSKWDEIKFPATFYTIALEFRKRSGCNSRELSNVGTKHKGYVKTLTSARVRWIQVTVV
jgi:ribosome-associated protein YbcJ (S4-like RNA binding protein)